MDEQELAERERDHIEDYQRLAKKLAFELGTLRNGIPERFMHPNGDSDYELFDNMIEVLEWFSTDQAYEDE